MTARKLLLTSLVQTVALNMSLSIAVDMSTLRFLQIAKLITKAPSTKRIWKMQILQFTSRENEQAFTRVTFVTASFSKR